MIWDDLVEELIFILNDKKTGKTTINLVMINH